MNNRVEHTRIKICGVRRMEDIQAVNGLGVDYVGMVFAKSRRQVSLELASTLRKQLKPEIPVVGVFVNEDQDNILRLLDAGTIQMVQLHGQETEEYIAELKRKRPEASIIKAISVTCLEDVTSWQDSKTDYLLLDNGTGGTGEAFDWSLLPKLTQLTKPYLIAGGLTPENVSQVLGYGAYGVDVSGGVETEGCKNPEKMMKFMKEVRR